MPAIPVPASQASPRQRYYYSLRDDDHLTVPTYSLFLEAWLLCSLRLCARATVENLSRHAKDCTALPSRDRGSQSFPTTTSESAPTCRRGLIACSSYPPTACVSRNNRVPRRATTLTHILSRCIFRLRGILKDHLAFLLGPMHLPPITPPDKRDTLRPAGVPESEKERETDDWLPKPLSCPSAL
jgi:hypothetical protein